MRMDRIPSPDFGISPGGRKHIKALENKKQPGGRNPGLGKCLGWHCLSDASCQKPAPFILYYIIVYYVTVLHII